MPALPSECRGQTRPCNPLDRDKGLSLRVQDGQMPHGPFSPSSAARSTVLPPTTSGHIRLLPSGRAPGWQLAPDARPRRRPLGPSHAPAHGKPCLPRFGFARGFRGEPRGSREPGRECSCSDAQCFVSRVQGNALPPQRSPCRHVTVLFSSTPSASRPVPGPRLTNM